MSKTFDRQKISQEELALKIFVSRQTISNWETNKSCPDVKKVDSIPLNPTINLRNLKKWGT